MSDRSFPIWRLAAAVAAATAGVLLLHLVFHRPLLPVLVIFAGLIGIGLARWSTITQRRNEERKSPPRDT